MEIENAVGANESVPGEGIEKAVDNVSGENSSTAGDLNIAIVDENMAPEWRFVYVELPEWPVPLLARNQLGGILLFLSVMKYWNVLELLFYAFTFNIGKICFWRPAYGEY